MRSVHLYCMSDMNYSIEFHCSISQHFRERKSCYCWFEVNVEQMVEIGWESIDYPSIVDDFSCYQLCLIMRLVNPNCFVSMMMTVYTMMDLLADYENNFEYDWECWT